jgi:uncharacterized protein (DUF58 family)
VPFPTPRAALLLLPGLAAAALGGGGPGALALVIALDLAALVVFGVEALRTPRPGVVRARRRLREPLSAFARNRVTVVVESAWARPLRLALADGVPAAFDAEGHRASVALPAGGAATLTYEVRPRARGRFAFGDLHVRVRSPLGLAARDLRVPLAREVSVYPDLGAAVDPRAPGAAAAGRPRLAGERDGREFRALRPYVAGDDVRAVDWKATARRGSPVVREWQPERNQAVWLLVDCGRHLSARLRDGRTKLDRAVDAALALARASAAQGDRAGAVLFGAEVERVVAPGAGRAPLGPLAEALHLAEARVEESDYGAAFDALLARQRRRALVVVFTDLADPDTSAALLARAANLRRHHLVWICAVSDSEIADAASVAPRDAEEAFVRAAAERIVAERERATQLLAAAGVRVESVPASALTAAVVRRYAELKARGTL